MNIDSNNIEKITSADVGMDITGMILVTRRPDDTGLSQHYLGMVYALDGAVDFMTVYFDEINAYQKIVERLDRGGISSVIFTEAFYFNFSFDSIAMFAKKYRIKIGLIFAWDSDVMDPADINAINSSVDVLLCVCAEFVSTWMCQLKKNIDVVYFNLPLDLLPFETLVPLRKINNRTSKGRVNVLSVGSYHKRKCHDLLVRAVDALVNEGYDLGLRIQSNLDQGEFGKIQELGDNLLGNRFFASNINCSNLDILKLYEGADIYVSASQGEGCNIGLRNALASGMPAVFGSIPGHKDLLNNPPPGVIGVDKLNALPALYPERSNQIFGTQYKMGIQSLVSRLRETIDNLGDFDPVLLSNHVGQQDYRRSKLKVWRVLTTYGLIESKAKYVRRIKGHVGKDILVVPSRDAGFFSLFNNYYSHMLYWRSKNLYDEVVPLWSNSATKDVEGLDDFKSFCYSSVEHENIFTRLFGYGAFEGLKKQPESTRFLSSNKSHNAILDPNLTYIHAEKKFRSAEFAVWRREINSLLKETIVFSQEILDGIEFHLERIMKSDCRISVLVRPPSHAIEQKGGGMASFEDYIRVCEGWFLDETKFHERPLIILATDQDYVVELFVNAFGRDNVINTYIKRVSKEYYLYEKSLPLAQRLKEGHQLQHQIAADKSRWGIENAVEVIIDALLLSMGERLIHVTSNIATAVSCLNPSIKLNHIYSNDDWGSLIFRESLLETKVY